MSGCSGARAQAPSHSGPFAAQAWGQHVLRPQQGPSSTKHPPPHSLPQAPEGGGLCAHQEVMNGGPLWSGTPSRTVEPGFAGPACTRLGGDFLPLLLSSAFQRSHRTLPGQQEGTAWGGDLGWVKGWVTHGG